MTFDYFSSSTNVLALQKSIVLQRLFYHLFFLIIKRNLESKISLGYV